LRSLEKHMSKNSTSLPAVSIDVEAEGEEELTRWYSEENYRSGWVPSTSGPDAGSEPFDAALNSVVIAPRKP